MSTTPDESTLHALVSRLVELEQAQVRLQEELLVLQAERATAEEQAGQQTLTRKRKSSRRRVLTTGLEVAAATIGAGALLELSSGTAQASSAKPGVFASSTAGTPAVSATGTNGADGVDASSDSGTGVLATSGSGTALVATTSTGLAAHFVGGNVNMDKNLTVAGALSTGTLSSGAGALASSVSGTPAAKASGTNGADGVDASSDSGTGVSATSGSGTGLVAKSSSGLAGHFMGNVQMDNNLTVTGTLSSGAIGFASSTAGVPAVSATGTNGADGVDATSDSGTGLFAKSGSGLAGHFVGNVGMDNNLTVAGALSTGTLSSGAGAFASSVSGTPSVKASGTNGARGLEASSDSVGIRTFGGLFGLVAVSGGTGIFSQGNNNTGVHGESSSSDGVYGQTNTTNLAVAGVHGLNISASNGGLAGLFDGNVQVNGALSITAPGGFDGVHAESNIHGVFGESSTGTGVYGLSGSGIGVHGQGNTGLAGLFDGNVQVNGSLTVSGTVSKGGGSFKIDHPLDPTHKYLSHSFVESPDMKNIYDGVVTLDANGEAEVRLPAWFDALNIEFRYQLTAIGASAPELYIAEEISGNRFKIAGGKAGMKVSWLVTGIRQDAWANAYRIPVEEDKPESEQGSYLHPELYGESEQKSLVHGR